MINVGFIGAGGIAETHAAALAHVDGARLVAVTDLVFERAEGLAHQFGATAVAGLAELLQFPGLDMVYILTPRTFISSKYWLPSKSGCPSSAKNRSL